MTLLHKPVKRVTSSTLGSNHGKDRGKRIVITLTPGNGAEVPDMITLRPQKSRRSETVVIEDVYTWALKCRVTAARMAGLREKKAKKQAAAEQRRSRRIMFNA